MAEKDYKYAGICLRVIDGDTVVLHLSKEFILDVDFGFHIQDRMSLTKTAEITVRLKGINTPEVIGPDKVKGLLAKAALEKLLMTSDLRVITYKADKYGRWLASIYVQMGTKPEIDVNQWMLDQGHAKPYDGTGPKP